MSRNEISRTTNKRGKLHSFDDKPAKILELGDPKTRSFLIIREWYENGMIHRSSGPAIIRSDGHQEFWEHNQRHCDHGPAIIQADGTGIFFIDGSEVTPEEIENFCGAHVSTTKPYFESFQDRIVFGDWAASHPDLSGVTGQSKNPTNRARKHLKNLRTTIVRSRTT